LGAYVVTAGMTGSSLIEPSSCSGDFGVGLQSSEMISSALVDDSSYVPLLSKVAESTSPAADPPNTANIRLVKLF